MLVVDMTVPFFLGRPAVFMVLAAVLWALPWTFVSLDMFGQVAGALELLIAKVALVDLWLRTLLSPSH